MKKINKLQPKALVGMEFNIPLFSAKKQIYKCIEVTDIHTNGWKEYYILCNAVPMGYSVPDDIRFILRFKDIDNVHVELYEVRQNRDLLLKQHLTTTTSFSTLKDIKETFYKLGL